MSPRRNISKIDFFRLFRYEKMRSSYLGTRFIFWMDVTLSVFASLFTLITMSFFMTSVIPLKFWVTYLVSSLAASVLMLFLFKTNRKVIRYLTLSDLVPFAISAVCKSLIISVSVWVICFYSRVIWLFGAFDIFVTLILLVGVRMIMIFIYSLLNNKVQERYNYHRTLIYGISDKAVAASARLKESTHYKIVGFINYGPHDNIPNVAGLPEFVFDDDRSLNDVLVDNRVDAILFSNQTDARAEEDRLIKYCRRHNVMVVIVPPVGELGRDGKQVSPREIRMEDLLGRQEIRISMDKISAGFNDRVVLVTGAAGSIGSELCRQLASFGVSRLVLFDNAETPMHNLRLNLEESFPDLDFVPVIGDVRQLSRLDYVFRTYRPSIVFHAAAYKHVPLMEENPCEAVLVNVAGSRNVADKCLEYDVEKMVMISTDKAVNPTNIMGCTKRLAEIYVQSLGLAVESGKKPGKTCFVTTRFGNVLGSNGSVIPRFREQIEKGGPVTVTHPEINRFFMTIPEACRLVMEAASMESGTRIVVFDMGDPVKIDDLARRMISLAGMEPDVDIKIEYTGLRPGEKLYEEVLSNAENTIPTEHERIRVAKVRSYDYEQAVQTVGELESFALDVNIPELVRLMKSVVPEFKSNHSVFEAYDKI